MKRIYEDDSRDKAIEKFDDCMGELFSMSKGFVDEIKRIINSDEKKIKVYTLALNFSFDITTVADNVEAYVPHIKNSLLSVRYDHHEKLQKEFYNCTFELRSFCKNVKDAGSVGVEEDVKDDYFETVNENAIGSIMPFYEGSYTTLTLMACQTFYKEGFTAYSEIIRQLDRIENYLSELLLVNISRTDSDFEALYDRAMDGFYSSDIWVNISKGYITLLMDTVAKCKKNTLEIVQDKISALVFALEEDIELGLIWLAHRENKTKLAKEIVNKEFEESKHIDQLFGHLGKKRYWKIICGI